MSIVGLGGPAGSQDLPSNKLFFAGLPPSLTEETFRHAFRAPSAR